MDLSPYSDILWFKTYMATSTSAFRVKLIKENLLEGKCSECGMNEWRGKPAPLQLDHIDGNRYNCLLSNLRILCANCHAQTPTYSGKNARVPLNRSELVKGYDKFLTKYGHPPTANRLYTYIGRLGGLGGARHANRIQDALGDSRPLSKKSIRTVPVPNKTKIQWPSDVQLEKLLETKSRVEIGEMLGVSDNAVKKRIKSRGLNEPDRKRSRPRKPSETPRELSEIKHGTRRGYAAELRRGIPFCDECRKANTEACNEYRRSKRKVVVD
jgi:hypothetical protein